VVPKPTPRSLETALAYLARGLEGLAATTPKRPVRVLLLEEGDSAADARATYLEENPEARGRAAILCLCLTLPTELAPEPNEAPEPVPWPTSPYLVEPDFDR
jgi:hypothetical protein